MTQVKDDPVTTQIHPSAFVDPAAQLGEGVTVGPFCLVEAGTEVGDGCQLKSGVVVRSGTKLGCQNIIDHGAVIGGNPQHIAADPEQGSLIIGDKNQIREHVTIHKALKPGHVTQIGNGNMLMIGSHVAHDCKIGNNSIIVNNVMLAGHVEVGDRAFLSGAVAVHQYCRIGSYAMVGGQAAITRDVPPYVTIHGATTLVVGLNLVGLKRAGFSNDDIRQLKEAYRTIYRRESLWEEMLTELEDKYTEGPAAAFAPFFRSGKRGFIPERRQPHVATVKLSRVDDETSSDSDAGPIRRAA